MSDFRHRTDMAECEQERGPEFDPNNFCCPVCLDLLKDPVGIPCGHSFCKGCIKGFWDQNEKGKFSCPQCREIFSPRPVLRRNNMLAEVVEMLKSTNTQPAPPSDPESAETCSSQADVPCDFCCGTNPNKATMSCLTCVVSYCPVHLKPHYSVPALKKHQLVSCLVPLQDKMCTKHSKLMEVYCRTDRKCICYLCVIDEHKSHSTVSVAAERDQQQKQLTVNQNKVQERRKEREEELTALLEALKDFKKCAQTAVEDTDEIFAELISSFKKSCTLTKQLISDQEKTAVAQAEGLHLRLEEEIDKLRKRDADLEQMSHIDDHILFIQTFQSLSACCESPDLANIPVRSKRTFRTMTDRMSELKVYIESRLKNVSTSISTRASTVNVLMQPEPKTREEFLRYCCPLKLDEKSVSPNMSLSQENLRATCKTKQIQSYNKYYESYNLVTQRLTGTEQMWCREGLTERCYWEVSFSGHTWCVAVSYKDNTPTPTFKTEFGKDNRSWSLECSSSGCNFKHNNVSRNVSGSLYSLIGVYLDCVEGILSFYSVSGTSMTLLHKEETTFTEPLYPCIGFKDDGSQKATAYHAQLIKTW